jgi:predicted solute-binding protein
MNTYLNYLKRKQMKITHKRSAVKKEDTTIYMIYKLMENKEMCIRKAYLEAYRWHCENQ